jgi:hypothetical protein
MGTFLERATALAVAMSFGLFARSLWGAGAPLPAQIGPPDIVAFEGCLAVQGAAFYVASDDDPGKVYEIRSASSRDYVGYRVSVRAAEVISRERTTISGAVMVVSVAKFTVVDGCSDFVCTEGVCWLKRGDCAATNKLLPPDSIDCYCPKCKGYHHGRILPKQ